MKIEATLACLQSSGTMPDSIDLLKTNVSGGASCFENLNSNLSTIPLGPAVLCILSDFSNLVTPGTVMIKLSMGSKGLCPISNKSLVIFPLILI